MSQNGVKYLQRNVKNSDIKPKNNKQKKKQ